MSEKIITGRVIDRDTVQGIKRLRVEAWGRLRRSSPRQRPRFRNEKLGEDTTKEGGRFDIAIRGGALGRLKDDKIWFKVFGWVEDQLADTQESIIWSPENPQEITIPVEWEGEGEAPHPGSELSLSGDDGEVRVHMDADEGTASLGGHDADGELSLFPGNAGDITDPSQATIHLDAEDAHVVVGGNDASGEIVLNSDAGTPQILLDAAEGMGFFGGKGIDGQILVFPATASDNTDPNQATIRLEGKTGDILLANADCAEDFEIAVQMWTDVEAGHVMILGDQGQLSPCDKAYDKRVAGVISGAGKYKPGIVLDKQDGEGKRMPLALVGKVFCWVDADYAGVEVGDLLTTSATLGHAMKATDREKAFGAVIGKALRPLASGTGLIPILVALQ